MILRSSTIRLTYDVLISLLVVVLCVSIYFMDKQIRRISHEHSVGVPLLERLEKMNGSITDRQIILEQRMETVEAKLDMFIEQSK